MIKISNRELIEGLTGTKEEFPKYVTQILNLANQNAQGTRPKVVGQLSDLIQQFPGKTYDEWKEWYLAKHPDAVQDAVGRISAMVENLKVALSSIDQNMIERWVKELVLEKTFIGLRFQESVLKKLSEIKKLPYRLSVPAEEARGIDGFIGDSPVSIKPITYKTKNLQENLAGTIIYYEKKDDGLIIDGEDAL
ncbi:MAG: MjaI family restriction endonuclease [Patescibacteria group bacterium]|jgi:hypothetical protein